MRSASVVILNDNTHLYFCSLASWSLTGLNKMQQTHKQWLLHDIIYNGGNARTAKRESEFYTQVDMHPGQHHSAGAAQRYTGLGHKARQNPSSGRDCWYGMVLLT